MGSVWGWLEIGLRSARDRVGVGLASVWNGIGSIWFRFGVVLGQFGIRLGFTLRLVLDWFGVLGGGWLGIDLIRLMVRFMQHY